MLNSPNAFDASLVSFLNGFSQRWYALDRISDGFEGDYLLKGGVLTGFLWWAWFRRSADKALDRSKVVAGVVGAIASLAVCRVLAYAAPFRVRPVFAQSLHFRAPFGDDMSSMINWSSFPSDHAGMAWAVIAAIFCVSRRAGILGAVYTAFFICLPRVYGGEHYPTDLLVGAAIGLLIGWVFQRAQIRNAVAGPPMRLLESAPGRFYVSMYVISLLLTTNFDLIRKVGSLFFHSLRPHGQG